MAWTQEDAAHLLRRTGFGGSTAQVAALYAKGRMAAVDAMLAFDATEDLAWDSPDPLRLGGSPGDNLSATLTLIYRYLATTRPLQARLTCFWQDYFSSAMQRAGLALPACQTDLWRNHAIGPFKAFLIAMRQGAQGHASRDHLGAVAVKGMKGLRSPVHAIPAPDYHGTPTLVAIRVDEPRPIQRTGHAKTPWVDCMETRLDVCTRLYRHFVSDQVSQAEIYNLLQTWKRSAGDLRAVISALLKSNAFWDLRARGALVKSALEFAGGLLQRFDHSLNEDIVHELALRLPELGPSPVRSNDHEVMPSGATVLLARYQFAYYAIYEIDPDRVLKCMTQGMPYRPMPNAFISLLAQRLGLALLTPTTRNAILEYLGPGAVSGQSRDGKVLGALYMLACSPEYQVS